MITLHTSVGDIVISVDTENTPKTAENFIQYAKSGFYNGTIFHRVIDNFMIQCGGLEADMSNKETGEPIENEAEKGGKNLRGTLAMARTGAPHSATSQFFINVKDNDFLNFKAPEGQGWGYCVFGEVTAGMDVVDKIRGVKTTSRAGHQDVPVEPITITAVTVEE